MATFDKTRCEEGILAPDLNDAIRANQEGLEEILSKEHNFETGGLAALQGIHKQGAARCFWQASAPGTRADGSAFTSQDLGALWIDSDNNKFYILTATTPTWTIISTDIITTLLAEASLTFNNSIEAGSYADGSIDHDDIRLANNEYLRALDAAGTGTVGLIAADSSDVVTIRTGAGKPTKFSSYIVPVNDEAIAPKKYVDDNVGSANYTPTSENGAVGSTGVTIFPNGLRIAYGSESVAAGGDNTITLSGWTAIYTAVATINQDNNSDRKPPKVCNISTSTFHIRNTGSGTFTFQWMAMGR